MHITAEVFFAIIGIMNKIQRKFLISADILRWLKQQKFSLEKTEQFYIKPDGDTECYYRKYFPDTYTKVTIGKEGEEDRSRIRQYSEGDRGPPGEGEIVRHMETRETEEGTGHSFILPDTRGRPSLLRQGRHGGCDRYRGRQGGMGG